MAETWSVLDETGALSGRQAVELLSAEIEDGRLATYFESDRGRMLAVVSNGSRAMVVLMNGQADPGEHAVSPGSTGSSDGYVLENGQEDTYDDADTVPLEDALDIVRSVVDSGAPPADAPWSVDR